MKDRSPLSELPRKLKQKTGKTPKYRAIYAKVLDGDLPAERIQTAQQPKKKQSLLQRLNPFWLKIPLFKPDVVLNQINGVFGWVLSPPAMIVWTIVCGWALVTLIGSWGEFTRRASTSWD